MALFQKTGHSDLEDCKRHVANRIKDEGAQLVLFIGTDRWEHTAVIKGYTTSRRDGGFSRSMNDVSEVTAEEGGRFQLGIEMAGKKGATVEIDVRKRREISKEELKKLKREGRVRMAYVRNVDGFIEEMEEMGWY